ncbi:hypothetical protein FACS189463_3760 [Bacteroidia bacterium]|nr:hypothetical protein FACS189463_3760 [Bacteroidia bacterium]
MNIENVEKKKRGRKPKAEPQIHRLWIRLNDKDRERFLAMYKRSGKPSYSAFIADCVLNKPLRIVEINKSTIDFVMLLSSFFKQFRAVKNNFNQAYYSLVKNFGEQKALEMIQIVAQSTREFGFLRNEIKKTTMKLRESCLPK